MDLPRYIWGGRQDKYEMHSLVVIECADQLEHFLKARRALLLLRFVHFRPAATSQVKAPIVRLFGISRPLKSKTPASSSLVFGNSGKNIYETIVIRMVGMKTISMLLQTNSAG